MHFGVSTACLYPMDTMSALQTLQGLSINYTEVFVNTFSELSPRYIAALKAQAEKHGTVITALHPFSCVLESFLFATDYPTRFTDGIRLYRKYFAACEKLGVHKMAFHGMFAQNPYPFSEHCFKYAQLRKVAASYGVDLCYENVVRCKCGHPEHIYALRSALHDEVSFLLDTKQMRRAAVPEADMLAAMCGKIRHVHLSDAQAQNDCVLPFRGTVDFKTLFQTLKAQQFDGDILVELYRDGFSTPQELAISVQEIQQAY